MALDWRKLTATARPGKVLVALLAAVLAAAGLAGAGMAPAEAEPAAETVPSFYVANVANNSVTGYATGADGNVAPVVTISGTATRLSGPASVVLDGAGRLYVHNRVAQTVNVYAPGADGNVAPVASVSCCFTGSGAPMPLAVYGRRLHVANFASIRPYAIGPTGDLTFVLEEWMSGSSTGLENSKAIAVDHSGHLYLASSTAKRVTKYAPGSVGDTAPIATIEGPATGLARPTSLAVDDSGRVYVGDEITDSVTVYAPGASGDAAPIATIAGPNTGIHGVSGLDIDGSGRLMVTSSAANSIAVFAPGANGDVAPVTTIAGAATGLASPLAIAATPALTLSAPDVLPTALPGTPYTFGLRVVGGTAPYTWSLDAGSALPAGLVLGADGVISGTSTEVGTRSLFVTVTDAASPTHRATRGFFLSVAPDAVSSFYVANEHGRSITLHSPPVDGDVPSDARIAGANTGLSQPSGLLLHGGRLYAANYENATVTGYARGADGDVNPTLTLAGPSTGLTGPSSFAIDSAGRLYVSNYNTDSIRIFAPGAAGDATPVASIAGAATGLNGPSALAFDSMGRLVVGNSDNNTVTTYAPGATGDIAPVATLAGTSTKLGGPSGLLIDGSDALWVANISAHTVTKYAPGASGNVAPIATIAGPHTGLGHPRGLALDGSGRLIVTNSTRNAVMQYAPGAEGDVVPLSTLYGAATGLEGPFAIALVPPNQPPACAGSAVSTSRDTPVSAPLSCTDANADPLTYTTVAGPTNGTLSGTAPNLTYTPNAGYAGPDSFMYKANDGTVDSNVATVTVSVTSPTFAFTGFFAPVDNAPVLNATKAGSAIPVKFSLGGDHGMDILAAGYPASRAMSCEASTATDTIEETVTAGTSSLAYDASSDRYTYVWKTNKAWAGSCRQLVIKLTDGTTHTASFRFK